jgi:hypothetical protein
MPVLPEVGSMMTVSRPDRPARSAASIMATPMRSLTLPRGLKNSSFGAAGLGRALEPHEGSVADRLGDVVVDAGHDQCRRN